MRPVRAAIDILSPEEKQLIHEKSLVILEKLGVHAPYEPFLRLLESHGAQVDYRSQTARFPRRVVEELLSRVPEKDVSAWEVSPVKGNVSTEIYIVDYRGGTRRTGRLDDVRKGIALLRRLDEFPEANAVVLPADVPEGTADVECYRLLYTYSQKPGGTYLLSADSASYVIEMARVLGRRLQYGFQTVSPLRFAREPLEIAMLFREKGLSAGCGPFVMSMASSPVTPAGALLMQNAEQLICLICSDALGTPPESYNAPIHPIDLHTLLCSFGSPSLGSSAMAGCSMARFYGLKPGGNVGLTDALRPDFQCGFEKAMTMCFSAFSGGGSIGGQGIVGADQGISLEQLVLDNEWISAFNASIKGVEVTEETLAEALIHELGVGGNFLGEEHTVRHMRESYWTTSLFNRQPWDDKIPYGGGKLLDAVYERVEEYTADYRSLQPVVTPSQAEEINRIAEDCRKRAAHTH